MEMDWLRIDIGLEWISNGLALDWHWIGNGLASDWRLTDIGLAWIGNGLALDRHWIGTMFERIGLRLEWVGA